MPTDTEERDDLTVGAAGAAGEAVAGDSVVPDVPVCAPPELEITTPPPRSTDDCDGDFSWVAPAGDGDDDEDADPVGGAASVVGAVVAVGSPVDPLCVAPDSAAPDTEDVEAPPVSDDESGVSAQAVS